MLFTPLTLPNGSTLPNRLAKAAMEESLAEPGQLPGAVIQPLPALGRRRHRLAHHR
jgi:2,4-dienoyl-CoA reductase-like NADH-dependent reductase (Old Yellow Enzyme family)